MSTRAAPARAVGGTVRGLGDLAVAATGALLLVLAALPVRADRVGGAEAAVERVLDGHTVLPFVVVWTVMQLGNLLAVPAVALAAALTRRWRLAAAALLAGAGTYELAKVVKRLVVRGRPGTLLPDVVVRGAEAHGLGFPSGHAAVVGALAAVAWPWLGRRGRAAAAVVAALVCLSRVYVGAHLPLDVAAGLGLGLAVGGLVRLVVGRPA
jgi:undecaprenyl-diphosphatase